MADTCLLKSRNNYASQGSLINPLHGKPGVTHSSCACRLYHSSNLWEFDSTSRRFKIAPDILKSDAISRKSLMLRQMTRSSLVEKWRNPLEWSGASHSSICFQLHNGSPGFGFNLGRSRPPKTIPGGGCQFSFNVIPARYRIAGALIVKFTLLRETF